ncbi:MAG: hypothetical protein E7L00_00225 [Propionibacteriaceae bacterium]|nr:hypothetical protein [Propionibacteriaceae bacterium]
MPELVTEAEFIRGKAPRINGAEFPYLIHEDGPYVDFDRGRPTTLWLPLITGSNLVIRTQDVDTSVRRVDSDV